jgi:hypothetical protein
MLRMVGVRFETGVLTVVRQAEGAWGALRSARRGGRRRLRESRRLRIVHGV